MATDITTRELRKPIDVAEYLFRRLHEVGIRSVHGVPGERSSPIGSSHSKAWD
jgi:pyruvate decarboxylase